MKSLYSIALIAATSLLFSCSVHKNLNTSEKMIASKSDSLSVVELFKKSQSETTISEQADTTVWTDSLFFSTDVADVDQRIETPELTITFDSQKGAKRKLSIVQKPKKVNLKVNRVSKVAMVSVSKEKSMVQVGKSTETKEKAMVKQVEKTGFQIPWYYWIALAAILALAYFLRRSLK